MRRDGIRECIQPSLVVLVGAHGDEGIHAHVQMITVEQRNPPGDHARFFEVPNAPPARRCTQVDRFGDFRGRQCGIVLEQIEYLQIDLIYDF